MPVHLPAKRNGFLRFGQGDIGPAAVPLYLVPPPPDEEIGAKGSEDARAWLASIVESSTDAILSKTIEGIITSWNTGAERIFGFSAEEAVGQSILILIPEDRRQEEDAILERIRRGERVEHFDTIRKRKDGSLVEVSVTVSPVLGNGGTILGASKIARDISERRRNEKRRKLLLREMNHRVKNLFSVASALVSVSERSASSAAELAGDMRDRLASLARAHDLILADLRDDAEIQRETTLLALLNAVLAPYKNAPQIGTSIKGVDVPLGSSAMTSLALIISEFATNAAKHGCFASAGGKLDVLSMIDAKSLLLIWSETGGPEIYGPARSSGFGTQLEQATIAGLDGTISRDWAAGGLAISNVCLCHGSKNKPLCASFRPALHTRNIELRRCMRSQGAETPPARLQRRSSH
ncbi:PAS domain S-box protein [Mesorhizobium sp. BR115XR7A]|uniref:sensor histidine kinase n=1 Tax=Mesorhizobium sp. BR115XR7A TaxID=2876645 RepID=UPI001CC8F12E|nr:PAS domain S-box protein [Mesorhizobium sp. BR115XR7A]MBZ9905585.1 PAS domain S-box protein [Mesorhizobium sp. BR115XR7A]MBZ9931778.1 PAS domain S-box protein [Mesorhizobium sp. BR1-1-5]